MAIIECIIAVKIAYQTRMHTLYSVLSITYHNAIGEKWLFGFINLLPTK